MHSDFDDSNLKFIASINKLLSIDNNDDYRNEYLTQINGSDIYNYTEKKISGNNVLYIDGFEFADKK